MFSNLYKLLGSRRSGRPDKNHRPRSLRPAFDQLEDRLAPATFTVTNLSDALMPPARGLDLRQAISQANLPANAGSTINFSVNGTIILVQGEYKITQPMTIDGTGHSIAIDGAAKSRDFFINTPGTVTFINLIIKNGRTASNSSVADGLGNGGGIYDVTSGGASILILTNDQIRLNNAIAPSSPTGGGNGGGVYTTGILTLNNTIVDGNNALGGQGGGIWAAKNITLNSSTVSNNTAAVGGGVYQAGTGTTVTLNSSTVKINKAMAGNGGGVWALFNIVGTGSTVSNNQALGGGNSGGLFSEGGNVTLASTVVTNNTATGAGGGIWADFNVVLLPGTTVSGNVGDTGGGGVWADDGFVKLFSALVSGNTAGGGLSTNGDGGGIWSGTDVTIDATSTVTGNNANGDGGGIYALSSVTINGGIVSNNAATTSTFDEGGAPQNGSGGGIWAMLDVTVVHGLITGNTAGLDGGGIYSGEAASIGGNVDVNSNSTISNNTAGVDGGGIWDGGGNVSVDSSTIFNNEANDDGGGIYVAGFVTSLAQDGNGGPDPEEFGSLSVTNSSLTQNRALVEGGGIYVNFIESVTVTNTIFDANSAAQNGGAIAAEIVENVAITGSTFTSNSATSGSGGALYIIGPVDLYLDSDTFGLVTGSGNNAGVSGGAVYLQDVSATINNCTFDNNISYGGQHSGSDLFVDSFATVDLDNSDFDDTLGLSAALGTDLIDVGDTNSPIWSALGVIYSSGGNSVWDSSWVNITNFDFSASGDQPNDQM